MSVAINKDAIGLRIMLRESVFDDPVLCELIIDAGEQSIVNAEFLANAGPIAPR